MTIGSDGNITADAMLQALANNGGPTMTHDLGEGSAAINAITEADPSEQLIDQRSLPRKQDGINDIGSIEKPSLISCYVAKTINNNAFTFCL